MFISLHGIESNMFESTPAINGFEIFTHTETGEDFLYCRNVTSGDDLDCKVRFLEHNYLTYEINRTKVGVVEIYSTGFFD